MRNEWGIGGGGVQEVVRTSGTSETGRARSYRVWGRSTEFQGSARKLAEVREKDEVDMQLETMFQVRESLETPNQAEARGPGGGGGCDVAEIFPSARSCIGLEGYKAVEKRKKRTRKEKETGGPKAREHRQAGAPPFVPTTDICQKKGIYGRANQETRTSRATAEAWVCEQLGALLNDIADEVVYQRGGDKTANSTCRAGIKKSVRGTFAKKCLCRVFLRTAVLLRGAVARPCDPPSWRAGATAIGSILSCSK